MIPGIDVSHWQGEIDWAAVNRSGVKFAVIKASEFPDKRNTLFVDDRLKINIAGAKANGILWSAYHFFRTHIDPVIQAQMFCATVGTFESLPPVLDLEVAGSRGAKLNDKVRKFLTEVERITNRKPIIYTSGSFWRSYMCYEKKSDADWARDYSLWLAQYTTLWPTPCYPWAGWDIWQYTDKGRIPGLKGAVDMNWFNGTYAELRNKYLIGGNAKLSEENMNEGKGFSTPAIDILTPTESSTPDHHSVLHGDFAEDSFISQVIAEETQNINGESTEAFQPDFHPLPRKDMFAHWMESRKAASHIQPSNLIVAGEDENWITDFYKSRTETEQGVHKES